LSGVTNASESVSVTDRGAVRFFEVVGKVLEGACKPALVAALVVIVVWCLGRIMEALHGNAVFDMTLTYWLGMVMFILLALWVVGWGMAALGDLGKARNTKLAVISWVFFSALVLTVLLSLEGYRISSAGLFAAIAGSAELSRQANFLLLKFHFVNPMLALNLAASKLVNVAWDTESLAPYVLRWDSLFVFFLWSLAYGIVLLMQRDKRGPKVVHLFFALAGLLALIIIKSLSKPTTEQMVMFQAASAILLVFQVLLAYACFRAMAGGVKGEVSGSEKVQFSPPDHHGTQENNRLGLPPSAMKLALSLFLILPVLADLQNQFGLSSSSGRIVYEITKNQPGSAPKFVTVADISIRSGPATGDEVVGVLPRGMRVPVVDQKNDWISIGKNRWIPEKFLRPIGPG
jgi:hypothetical protein